MRDRARRARDSSEICDGAMADTTARRSTYVLHCAQLVGLDAEEVRAQVGADDPRVAGHRNGVEVEGPPARGAHLTGSCGDCFLCAVYTAWT